MTITCIRRRPVGQTIQIACAALLASLFCHSAAANVEQLRSIPVPQSVTSEVVAVNIVQHGHRMSMAQWRDVQSEEAVLNFLREQWGGEGSDLPGYVEELAGGWKIFSRVENGWNKVVQVRQNGAFVETLASVLELEPQNKNAYKPAMPRGTTLVSALSSQEFGKSSQTDVMYSKSRVGELAAFFRSHYSKGGWHIVHEREINNSITFLIQQPGKQAEVVVTPAMGGSVAVRHELGEQ